MTIWYKNDFVKSQTGLLLGLGRYIDADLANMGNTVSIRLGAVSRYFHKFYLQQIW